MAIPLFTTPVPSTADPVNFSARADTLISELNPFVGALNLFASDINNLSTNGTSTTSNTVGTGSKSFTVEVGKTYFTGMSLIIARTAAPTNRMFAVVTSHNSGTGALVVTSQAFEGSGTFSDWSISLAYNGIVQTAQLADKFTQLLATYTASASAQIDITAGFDGTYSSLEFVFENILPATNAVSLFSRVSTDGGSTFISTTTYFSSVLVNSGATAVAASADSGDNMSLNGATNLSNLAGETLNGTLNLFSPATPSARPYAVSQVAYRTSSSNNSICLRGSFNTNTNINAIRFYMSSGNIASGKIYVYGRRK